MQWKATESGFFIGSAERAARAAVGTFDLCRPCAGITKKLQWSLPQNGQAGGGEGSFFGGSNHQAALVAIHGRNRVTNCKGFGSAQVEAHADAVFRDPFWRDFENFKRNKTGPSRNSQKLPVLRCPLALSNLAFLKTRVRRGAGRRRADSIAYESGPAGAAKKSRKVAWHRIIGGGHLGLADGASAYVMWARRRRLFRQKNSCNSGIAVAHGGVRSC